jgi:tetratricopeptide (TPR) repeat protein
MFSLTSIYEKAGDKDKIVSHLREYLAKFGDKGGADRKVIAYAKIGLNRWEQSCKVKQLDGSCVTIVRERAISTQKQKRKKGASEQPKQCGPESKIKLTVVKRDDRKMREALKAFAAAAKEFEKTGGKTGGDELGARYYYAQAKFAEADKDFEAYLDLKFPQGLNFDPDPKKKAIAEKSLKRFEDWLKQRKKFRDIAESKYKAILEIRDNATSIATAARLAQVAQNLSDALFTATIPEDVRTGEFADDKVEAFCDRMTEVAEPLDKQALDAYGVCLNKSTELGWFSEWSKMCERELGQINPNEYPTASELRAKPEQVAPIIAVEPPIRKLE